MKIWPGQPYPLGATYDGSGTNFSIFSGLATDVQLCLFDDDGNETCTPLPERTALVYHGYVPNVGPGQRYGYRIIGPYEPANGCRCNPAKLMIDPYATAVEGEVLWKPRVMPYVVTGKDDADLVRSDEDNADLVPKCIVTSPYFDWGHDRPPRTPWHKTIVYETHVKGYTNCHPGLDPAVRGTYAGLADPVSIAHLTDLGVTAVELLPVHQYIHDAFLVERGLTQLLGLQLDRLPGTAQRLQLDGSARRAGQRVQAHGQGPARGGDRGDPRRRLQPHRRGQPARPLAVPSAASTTSPTTASSRTTSASTSTTPGRATASTCATRSSCS